MQRIPIKIPKLQNVFIHIIEFCLETGLYEICFMHSISDNSMYNCWSWDFSPQKAFTQNPILKFACSAALEFAKADKYRTDTSEKVQFQNVVHHR